MNVSCTIKPLIKFFLILWVRVRNCFGLLFQGSAACIIGFANFDECGVGIKEKATEVLMRLTSDDRDMIAIPVIFTQPLSLLILININECLTVYIYYVSI